MRRWDLYDTFVAVVDAGSFSAAAARLGVSKSLVSRKVTTLERELGAQLLFRTTRRINPTDAGHQLYLKCARLLSNLEEAGESVRNMEEVPRGHLRVAAADWFGERYLSACTADFNLKYPDLKIDVHITNLRIDLVAERYDLALHYGALPDSSYRARRICMIPHVVCGAPAYFTRMGWPHTVNDLRRHNCLVSDFEFCTTWHFKTPGGRVDIDLEGTWRSNNGQALMHAALQGLGLCRLPLPYVHEHVAAGRLLTVLDEFRDDPFPVWLLYPNTRYVSAKVRLFIDFFHDWMQAQLRPAADGAGAPQRRAASA
jgi:DNA-binding transcriptional LysR family regulator